jgi:hypothetical protein
MLTEQFEFIGKHREFTSYDTGPASDPRIKLTAAHLQLSGEQFCISAQVVDASLSKFHAEHQFPSLRFQRECRIVKLVLRDCFVQRGALCIRTPQASVT